MYEDDFATQTPDFLSSSVLARYSSLERRQLNQQGLVDFLKVCKVLFFLSWALIL